MFRALLIAIVTAGVTGTALGQNSEKPKPYRWEEEAKAQKLTDKDVELLKQNKFVITGSSYKQIFTPYIGSDVPVFITSDSLLNGFHVLFEESICSFEKAQARKLPGLLDELARQLDPAGKQLKGDAELVDAARKRAAIFLGVACHPHRRQ